MSNGCEDIRQRLGGLLDEELDVDSRQRVEQHVTGCEACRLELVKLESITRHLASEADTKAPAKLWLAIERRLDGGQNAAPQPRHNATGRRWYARVGARPLAAAAVVLLTVGAAWLAFSGPWQSRAAAAEIDFRPLLDQADGDIAAGIQALMNAYGGQPITASAAESRMRLRIQAPDELPPGMKLNGRYLLNMGRSHQALAFDYAGPSGKHLLLLQCPPMIRKNYGGRECMACSVGGHDGEGVQVGKLRLMHMSSENVCVCVVSTLSETDLKAALLAVKITL